jgi:hypothetical protein
MDSDMERPIGETMAEVSQAARGLVLLGDPQQLDQPMQGSHPEGHYHWTEACS